MNELKPCPFCGGKATAKSSKYNLLGAYGTAETDRKWSRVFCKSCNIGQPKRHYISKEDAIQAWNRRVNETNNL